MIITCAIGLVAGVTRIIRDGIEEARIRVVGEGRRKYNVMQIHLIAWSGRNRVH